MATELSEVLTAELRDGEKVLWRGRCLSRLGKQSKDTGPVGTAIVGALVGVIPGIFISVKLASPVPMALGLIAGIVLSIAFYRNPGANYRKSRTLYGLTNRRVIVIQDLDRNRKVRSLPLEYISRIDTEHATMHLPYTTHMKGTVTFTGSRADGATNTWHCLRFFMVESPDTLARLVSDAQERRLIGTE